MRSVLCFLYQEMWDFEVSVANHLVSEFGKRKLVTIAYEKAPVRAASGVQYLPHCTVNEALQLAEVEGLLIPGGPKPDFRPELTELIRKLNAEARVLAAICAGPRYLAQAGVLDGRSYTTSIASPEERRSGGFPAKGFLDERVVRDGHIVTAKGHAFVDFSVEVYDALGLIPSRAEKEHWLALMKHLVN